MLSSRIEAPIFVARQLVKHQVGLSWNEVSRRYVDDLPKFFEPAIWRGRPTNSKQGSDGTVANQMSAKSICQQTNNAALTNYQRLLDEGVAPEQARMVLPQTMMTEWYWSGSLQAFARMQAAPRRPHSRRNAVCSAADCVTGIREVPSQLGSLDDALMTTSLTG